MQKVQSAVTAAILVIALFVSIAAFNYTFTNDVKTLSAEEIAEAKAYNVSLPYDQTFENGDKIPSVDYDHVDGGINEYGVVFKVIRVVLIVILVGCVLLAALSGIMVALFSRRRARYIKTSGNFEYIIKYDRNGSDPKYASITGFTSAGRKKEVIDIPRVIDGIPVRCMGGKNDVDYGPTSTHYFVFENDVLKKMYVHSNIETICDNVFDKMPDLEIMLCANELIMHDDYTDDVKTVYVYRTLYEREGLEDEERFFPANVVFMNNYSDVTNGGYYRLDNIAEGETIPEPPAPEREGYEFGGWYTEAECVTAWDFGESPTIGEDGEFRLYARWIAA